MPKNEQRASLRDIAALGKPSIMVFSLIIAVGGMYLAPGSISISASIALLLGTALIVGAANALNMYLERDLDAHMARTKNRPLPAGRMQPRVALVIGWAQALVALPLLALGVNLLTAILGAVAFVSYVFIYTPLKKETTLSTVVGAVPGAMPTLMGWTGVSDAIDPGGAALFAVLFFWQLPHFFAISLYRSKEYLRAGLQVLPNTRGVDFTKRAIAILVVVQVIVSLLLVPLGIAGSVYLVCASILGAAYCAYGFLGVRASSGPKWARKLFLASVIYLPLLFAVLILDA